MPNVDVKIKDGMVEDVLATAFAPVVALSELVKNSSDACVIKNDIIKIDIDTKSKTIRLKDNGSGFSEENIQNFKNIGYSEKMINDNTLSLIGEPYAGSKGLGILTAFNLCNKLEILTYSKKDNCSYKIIWIKGTTTISYKRINNNNVEGTEFVLYDVSDESIKLLTMEDELVKFYMSSVNYYMESNALPTLEVYVDGTKKIFTPKTKIENLYQSFKKPTNSNFKGYFIAKASFYYSNNNLTLSYEDNIEHMYNFSNEIIDLSNITSVNNFLKNKKINTARFRDIYNKFDKEAKVDDFEGVYYIWRDRRNDEITTYPCGVRIYVNNYGMYDYLNKDFDWLQHSEISQNKKATNYKLRNTFGYVHFKNYNESLSSLKISKERNDFIVNLSKKKFLSIMCDFISGILSDIDINIKNYNANEKIIFEDKTKGRVKRIVIGALLRTSDIIKTNLTQEEISVSCSDGASVDENDIITFQSPGSYNISFSHNDQIISIDINVEEKTPSFDLKKYNITIDEGNTRVLRDEIKISSLKNLSIEDIVISSETAEIKKGNVFSGKNHPGDYIIKYFYEKDGHEASRTLELTVNPLYATEATRIKNLFPNNIKKYQKINDIIDGIAMCYTLYPTVAMIAIRSLLEISIKAFMEEFYDKETKKYCLTKDFDPQGKMEHIFNSIRDNKIVDLNGGILNKYKKDFQDNRKNITKYYKELDPNTYIHNKYTQSTSKEVLQTMKVFQPILNFIFEAINSQYTTS
ncbi:MAG: ATP-binding protein [Candidatus Peribacteria bacterium]|jgi:molecular chaperone HtpG|nr:ATP-binding protein [Candidatus Peribacteria bacterium]